MDEGDFVKSLALMLVIGFSGFLLVNVVNSAYAYTNTLYRPILVGFAITMLLMTIFIVAKWVSEKTG